MAKFRYKYAIRDDQRERLDLVKRCAKADKEIAQMYVYRIMEERAKQKKKERFDGDVNSTIFIAKRFSTISHKREVYLDELKLACDQLFGSPELLKHQ